MTAAELQRDDALGVAVTHARPALIPMEREMIYAARPDIRAAHGGDEAHFYVYHPGWRAAVVLGAPTPGLAVLRLMRLATAMVAERC